MSETAIQVERLGKRYLLGQGVYPGLHGYNTLRDAIATQAAAIAGGLGRRLRQTALEKPPARSGEEHIWALREVSFEVERGGVLGIIGPNGAGKSTLLKILSRITKPTTGRAEIYGRVGSLLEIGTGFHPELTGRENIYLNGAILGMKNVEIQRKFAQIVEFAEIEKFLDTPVKRYSSGMAMRLAFSVAAHLEPEILLVDEVLAVGDAAFQRKCLGRVGEVAHEGRTVFFVSHNMQAVLSLCQQALLLQEGKLVNRGPARDVVRQYLGAQTPPGMFPLESRTRRGGDGTVRVVSLRVESADSDGIIRSGSGLRLILDYRSPEVVRYPQFVISIYDQMDIGIFVLHNEFLGGLPECLPPSGTVTCLTEAINLTPGRCVVHLELLKGNVRADYVPHAGYFDVEPDHSHGSIPLPPRNWALCLLKHRWWLNEH